MNPPFNKLRLPLKILSIGVIGILIAAGLARHVADDVRHSRVSADLYELRKHPDEYRAATGSYPTTQEGFEIMIQRPSPSPPNWKQIFKIVPIDAWGNLYRYRLANREGKEVPEVYSCGRDGIPETEDDLSSLD